MKFFLSALIALTALTATAKDAMIGPDAWRELSTGKTLY